MFELVAEAWHRKICDMLGLDVLDNRTVGTRIHERRSEA